MKRKKILYSLRPYFITVPFVMFCAFAFWPEGGEAPGAPKEVKPVSLDLPADSASFRDIRILLEKKVTNARIEAPGEFRLLDSEGHILLKGMSLPSTTVTAGNEGIRLGSQNFRGKPVILDTGDTGHIYFNGKSCRKALAFWPEPDGLMVVNHMLLEDYLKGVLPWEANPNWTMDALKAQAIVSRTFGLFKAIEHRADPYDVTKDQYSQVYAGKVIEKPETNQAVAATRGQILVYQGKIFTAFFHSTCGGATTRDDYVWPVQYHPVLKGVACPFCVTSKHYHWEAKYAAADIEKILNEKGYPVKGLRTIEPVEPDESGRARFFLVETATGKAKYRSADFRLWMDPGKLKSTYILSVQRLGNFIFFRGKGWGHGVGMCQFGAKRLGELGYSFKQILQYYFPGSDIFQYFADSQ